MEVEKMEIESKPVTVKTEILDNSEQKMDVVIKQESLVADVQIPESDAETKGIKKEDQTVINIIPKEAGLAYLVVEGMTADDENITMTAEEVRDYIEKAVMDHINKNNPLSALNKHAREVEVEVKEKRDELQKLAKLIDIIERDQLKFLRTDKTLRKFLTKTGGVGIDLPVLPNSVPSESLLRSGSLPLAAKLPNHKPASSPVPASLRTFTPSPVPVPSRTTASIPASTPVPTSSPSVAPTTPKAIAAAPAESSNGDKTQKPAPKPAENIECIDLTDESEAPPGAPAPSPAAALKNTSTYSYLSMVKHPAPLPPKPFVLPNKNLPPVPPKPRLKISSEERGIVLQWDMMPNTPNNLCYAPLSTFEIFGYQEQKNIPINTLLWKKIGSVKAMTLPMACTLTQFIEGNKYHFSIRAVDVHSRCGCYSDPISIVYNQSKS